MRRNKKQTEKSIRYNLSSLAKSNIYNHYSATVRNKFDTLQDTSGRHTPNDEYENFVTVLLKVEAECTPTNQSAKCTVPRESKAVKEN